MHTTIKKILIMLAVLVLTGCGGGASAPLSDAPGDLAPSSDLGELSDIEKLIYTDSYAGRLIVHFDEAMDIPPDKMSGMQAVMAEHPAAKLNRLVAMSAEDVDARRRELEHRAKKKLTNWNYVYTIDIEDPDEAVQIMRALDGMDGIRLLYPDQVIQDMDLSTTPDLIAHQGYLYPAATHGGLNAVAAWNAGIYGQDVTLVDSETGWNDKHLDLPLTDPNADFGFAACFPSSTNPSCPSRLSHGTAVVGILGALDNGHGITGFAPQAAIKIAGAGFIGVTNAILALTDGQAYNGELAPGSVLVFPVGFAGKFTPGGVCGADVASQYGCMPIDINVSVYDAVEDAVAAGITVVESAANGQMDLDDPLVYRATDKDLSVNDSGAIIVGASEGANLARAFWSNCGSRVTSFAWGQGVATTGYPYGMYAWYGTMPPIPPNANIDAFFVDMFSGTSAAAPIVAGAAALLQSYAKSLMSHPDTRYLTPAKMRNLLAASGNPQSSGACNIGTQTDIGIAMNMIDAAWNGWRAAHPEIDLDQPLGETDYDSLIADGFGIICIDGDPAASDPLCPDHVLWEPGSGIAKTLDVDGDGRADLVSWQRGVFNIDLSTAGSSADGFGSWDLTIAYPQIAGDIVWPYLEDIDADGRADLVLYDKMNGTWYIAFMTRDILEGGALTDWDHVITTNVHDQLDMDPWQSMYCRPLPGDYDADGWIDLAVSCSNGIWYIAHNSGDWPASITYDTEVQYLTAQQLGQAPGWAYLTATHRFQQTWDSPTSEMIIKVPDGLPDEGRVIVLEGPNFTTNTTQAAPHIFGGNDHVMLPGKYQYSTYVSSIGIKGADGSWQLANPDLWSALTTPAPGNIYGDISCHPIAADFDGDGKDDRAVMCPDEWRIAYSGGEFADLMTGGARFVALGYDAEFFTLPGRSYAGGISYDAAQGLIDLFQELSPTQPPPIVVDMVTIDTLD